MSRHIPLSELNLGELLHQLVFDRRRTLDFSGESLHLPEPFANFARGHAALFQYVGEAALLFRDGRFILTSGRELRLRPLNLGFERRDLTGERHEPGFEGADAFQLLLGVGYLEGNPVDLTAETFNFGPTSNLLLHLAIDVGGHPAQRVQARLDTVDELLLRCDPRPLTLEVFGERRQVGCLLGAFVDRRELVGDGRDS